MEVTHTTISRSLIRGILFAAVLCLLFSGSAGASPYLNINSISDTYSEYPANAVFTFSSADCTDLKVNFGDGTPEFSLGASSKSLSHTYELPGTYTVWLNATANEERFSTTKKIVVLPHKAGGSITITSEDTEYYLLEPFTVSGTNTYGDTVRVYIAGMNFPITEFAEDAVSVVNGKWSVEVDTFGLISGSKKLDVGTYDIYAVSSEETIQSLTELENKKYAKIQIGLKQPHVTITSSPSGVTTSNSVVFSGMAYGADDVVYYLFNNEEMITECVPVSNDNTFRIEISTSGFESGEYRIGIQHPMYDKEFNIYPVSIGNGDYEFYLKPYNSQQGASVIFDTKDRDFLSVAQALRDAINQLNVDDMYDDSTFIYLTPADSNTGIISITNTGLNHVQNKISFSGVNTATDFVYIYLKTPTGVVTCLTEEPDVPVDMRWKATASLPRLTELGTYEFYAVASDSSTAPAISDITKGKYAVWEFENIITAYINPDENPDTPEYDVTQDKEASISGKTKDTLLLQYYVLGLNYVSVGTVAPNSKGEFSILLDTAKSSMSTGEYFVVIQHPGDDTVFNVGPVSSTGGGYDIVLNIEGSYNIPGSSVLFNLKNMYPENAAGAFCDVLYTQNIDDRYTAFSFFVVSENEVNPKPEPTEIYYDVIISPSESLDAGQSVTGSLKVRIPGGSMIDSDSLTITSPLENLKISTDVKRNGETVINDYESSKIYGFILNFKSDTILEITFTGVVSEESKGTYINVIKITSTVSEIGTYTSPEQPVAPILKGSEKVNLNPGWNFISVPKYLDSSCDTAGELLGSLETDGISPLGYDAKTGWYVLKADTAVKPLDGYWVYSKGADEITLTYSTAVNTPPSKTVYKGWNAVGLSAEKPMTAKSAFSNLDWVRCMPWDTEQSKWGTVIVNGGSSENSAELKLGPGNGHWLYVEADGTYLGNTA